MGVYLTNIHVRRSKTCKIYDGKSHIYSLSNIDRSKTYETPRTKKNHKSLILKLPIIFSELFKVKSPRFRRKVNQLEKSNQAFI